jgi:hypothetical protein
MLLLVRGPGFACRLLPCSNPATHSTPHCLSSQPAPQLLRSWGLNKTEVAHHLKLMEACLQAEVDARLKLAAAAAAAAADSAAAAEAEAAAGDGTKPAAGAAATAQTPTTAIGSSAPREPPAGVIARSSSSGSSSMHGSNRAGSASRLGGVAGAAAASAAATFKAGAKQRLQSAARAAAGSASSSRGASAAGQPARPTTSLAAQLEVRTCCCVRGLCVHQAQALTLQTPCSPLNPTQARYERGLTFGEFVAVVMAEPPKATIKLKDVAALAGALLGGGGGSNGGRRGKQQQPAPVVAPDAAGA